MCVLQGIYANDGRYPNMGPNFDVNYSAPIIIICLMRRKVEETIELKCCMRLYRCLLCVCFSIWGRDVCF